MARAWDRLSVRQVATMQDGLVAEQVKHVIAPFSPYWKRRLGELGRAADSITTVASLATVPAVGERDVSPAGDPTAMAALVVQATEGGFVLHAPGPQLRRALWRRLTDRDAYRQLVESDTKPTSFVWTGLGFRYVLASTRGDLDVLARAGARLWQVLGLTGADALLSAVPVAATVEHTALWHAAMATGTPALFPGDGEADLVAAARLAPPTVLAVPSARAVDVLALLGEVGLESLRTVLLVGAPSDEERAAAQAAVGANVAVLAVHAPAGARVLWADCRESSGQTGLHTYPDLDVVQLVDPDTGDPAADAGEVVLTQLGMRGSALLRWRTGDLATGRIEAAACPACGRTVPRVAGVRRAALVIRSEDGRALDLRALTGALSGRTDLSDWRVVVGGRERDGRGQVLVHLSTDADPAEVAVGTATDIRAVAGLLPTQIVVGADGLAAAAGAALTGRITQRA